jgi:hypothetical protein
MVRADRIGEQIAQALLKGEALGPRTGPERIHHMVIQLPNEDLSHGVAPDSANDNNLNWPAAAAANAGRASACPPAGTLG